MYAYFHDMFDVNFSAVRNTYETKSTLVKAIQIYTTLGSFKTSLFTFMSSKPNSSKMLLFYWFLKYY